MATLPILDWNADLMRALANPHRPAPINTFAATLAIDPYVCWEDLVDLLIRANILGVANFPSAAMCETDPMISRGGAVNGLELNRLEWFGRQDFKIFYIATNWEEARIARLRLLPYMAAVLLIPHSMLKMPMLDAMPLRGLPNPDAEDDLEGILVFSLAQDQ